MKKIFISTNDSNFKEKYYQSGQDKLFKFIDLDTLMRETQYFDNDNLRENYSRIILMKLLYFINQGVKIDVLDMELLYFRITKLFKFESPFLKRIAYTILKIIIDKKFEFMLLSCLKKDITSRNTYLRMTAIRMVPYLTDEQNIIEFQKYIQMAVMDKCQQIQSAALLSALHINLKYPNILSLWSYEIKDSLQNNNVHALLLLCKIQKDKNLFLKTLIQIIQYKLQPHFIMNALRFIKEILLFHKKNFTNLEYYYQKELVQYLFLQLSSKDDLLIFEAFKIIMMIESLPENLTRSLINILCGFLRPEVVNISQYTSLQILKTLSNLNDLNKLVNNKLLEKLEDSQIYSPHAGISANSLFLCMKINIEINSSYLEKIFIKSNDLGQQINFLQGLIEFSDVFHIFGREILRFLEIIITKNSSEDLIKQAFKVIKFILKDVNQKLYLKSIHTLCSIAAKCDNKYKLKVVLIIHKEFYQTPNKKLRKSDAYDQFLGFYDLFSEIQDYTFNGVITKFNNYPKVLQHQNIIKKKESNRIQNKTFNEGDIFDYQNQKETIQLLKNEEMD